MNELLKAIQAIADSGFQQDKALLKLIESLIDRHLILEERMNLLRETVATQTNSLLIARECIEMLASRIGMTDKEVEH